MTCTQGTGGCVPTGYRSANCTISNLKPSSYVVPCVKAVCPSVYGYSNGKGESCFAPQKVALDGTAKAFFALLPDATYGFATYSATKSGPSSTVIASATAVLLSSVGEGTQCGGQPSGSCL
jgi:hypothetical protein